MRGPILAGLAAAFQVLLFPPHALGGLAWVALVPLLVALDGVAAGAAAATGWIFGSAAAFGLVTGWLWPALAEFFGAPLATRVGLLALAVQLGGGLPLAAFGVVVARTTAAGPVVRVLLVAAAWTAIEYGRGRFPYAIPWAPLGAAIPPDGVVAQTADLGGVHLVSFALAAANAALAVAWTSLRTGRVRSAIAALAAGIVVVSAAAGYGGWRRAEVARAMAIAPTLRIALVHAELENARRQGAMSAHAALDDWIAESPPAGSVDLVVWPENAVNLLLDENPALVARIAAHAGATPYLVGAPRAIVADGRPTLRTSALVIENGAVRAAYDKRRLLPFAETMPSWRGAGQAAPSDFTPGAIPTVLVVQGRRLGPLICYEAIFPELARDTVRAGAEILVNVSNDSWFPPGAGPGQHVSLALLRAVELRRTLVRAANRGITTVVLPDGRRTVVTDGRTPGVEIVDVPLMDSPTVYAAAGDVFAGLCVLATGIAAVVRRRNPRREPQGHRVSRPS
ncbi:MAG: apolipoprotein N-acyltransferase [Deltaproteobacteria bacterium]|nr:apolipoprotein N-acyltransferase [Deltaproteobacteria bacterium]